MIGITIVTATNHKEWKVSKFSNNLTDAQLERLALLSEECAETIQIVNKIIRHGYGSCNPFDETKTTNRELLEKEIGHMQVAHAMLCDGKDIDDDNCSKSFWKKRKEVNKYLHHQSESTNKPQGEEQGE